MELEPPTREQRPAGVPPSGPTRYLRATPSQETLRETGWAHVVIGCAVLLLSTPLAAAALDLWHAKGSKGSPFGSRGGGIVADGALLLVGFGLYRIVRGAGMILAARRMRASSEQPGRDDAS